MKKVVHKTTVTILPLGWIIIGIVIGYLNWGGCR